MKTNSSACFCQLIIQSCLNLIPSFGFCHIDENVLTIIQFHQKSHENQDPLAEKQKFNPSQNKFYQNINNNQEIINPADKRQRVKVYFNTKSLATEKQYKTSQWKMARDIISFLLFGKWNCPVLRQQLANYNISPFQFMQQKLDFILFTFMHTIENLTKLVQGLHVKNLNEFLQPKPVNNTTFQSRQKFYSQVQPLNFEPKIHIDSYKNIHTGYSPHSRTHKAAQQSLEKYVNRGHDNYYNAKPLVNKNTKIISSPLRGKHLGQRNHNKMYSPPHKSPIKHNVTFTNHHSNNETIEKRSHKTPQKLQHNYYQPRLKSNNFQPSYAYKPIITNYRSPSSIQQQSSLNFQNKITKTNKQDSHNPKFLYSNLASKQENSSTTSYNHNDHKRISSFNQSPSQRSFCKSNHSKSPINKQTNVYLEQQIRQPSQSQIQKKQYLVRCNSELKQHSQNSNVIHKKDSMISKTQKEISSNKKYPPLPDNREKCFESEKVSRIIKNSEAQNRMGKKTIGTVSSYSIHEDSQLDKKNNKTQKELIPSKSFQISERSFVITKDESMSVVINPFKSLEDKKKKNSICHEINAQIIPKNIHKLLSFSEWQLKIPSQNNQNQQKKQNEKCHQNQSIQGGLLIDEKALLTLKQKQTQIGQNKTQSKNQNNQNKSKLQLDNIIQQIPLEQQESKINKKKSQKKIFESLLKKGPDSMVITPNKKNSKKNIHIIHQKNDSPLFPDHNVNFKNETKITNEHTKKVNTIAVAHQSQIIKISEDTNYEKKRKENLISKYLKPKKELERDDDRRYKTGQFHIQANKMPQHHLQSCRTNKSYSNGQGNFKSNNVLQVRQKKYSDCMNYSPSQKNRKNQHNTTYDIGQLQIQKKENQRNMDINRNFNQLNTFRPRQNFSEKIKNQEQHPKQIIQFKEKHFISHHKIPPPPLLKKDPFLMDDQSEYMLPNKSSEAPSTQRQKSMPNIPFNMLFQTQQDTQRYQQSSQRGRYLQFSKNQKSVRRNHDRNYMDWKFSLDSGIQYNIDDKVAYKQAKFKQLKIAAKRLLC